MSALSLLKRLMDLNFIGLVQTKFWLREDVFISSVVVSRDEVNSVRKVEGLFEVNSHAVRGGCICFLRLY